MFIIVVAAGSDGIMEAIILKSVPNILLNPLTYVRGSKRLGSTEILSVSNNVLSKCVIFCSHVKRHGPVLRE